MPKMTETEVLKERERLVREAEERKQLSYVEKVIQINPKKTSILQSKEKKTKQIPLYIKPSLFETLNRICYDNGISFNEAINRLIEDYLLNQE